MHILNLPLHNPNLMTIGPSPQTIKLAQHIHTPHLLINNIPPHPITLTTPPMRQTAPTRPRQRRALHPLAVRAPRYAVRGRRVRPHVEVCVAGVLEDVAGGPGGGAVEGRPVFGFDVAEGLCGVEEEIACCCGYGVDHSNLIGIIVAMSDLCAYDERFRAGGRDPHAVRGAGDGVRGGAGQVHFEGC